MARFNVNEYNKDIYREVTLEEGLKLLKEKEGTKMFSGALEFDEYIVWVKDHYEYEDGCFLGRNLEEIKKRVGVKMFEKLDDRGTFVERWVD